MQGLNLEGYGGGEEGWSFEGGVSRLSMRSMLSYLMIDCMLTLPFSWGPAVSEYKPVESLEDISEEDYVLGLKAFPQCNDQTATHYIGDEPSVREACLRFYCITLILSA